MLRTARIAALLLPVLCAGILAIFPLHNDDAGFHVATGRWILATGEVPRVNPFTYAGDGATWTQHQWLPAVGIALVVDQFGVPALVLVKAALVALAFALLAWSLHRSRTPVAESVLLLCLAVAASAFRFYERPYLFSILALALTATGLLAWQGTDVVRARRGRWLAALTPVVAVHLHAGALDSVLLWLAFVVGHAMRHLPRLQPPSLSRPPLREVLVAAVGMLVALVAGLWALAPSGLALLKLPFSFSGNAYWHAHLAEFRPLSLDGVAALQWPAVVAAVAAGLYALTRRRWFEALALLGFASLAIRHVRMVWPMATVLVPVAGSLAAQAAQEGMAWLRSGRTQALAWTAAGVLAAAAALDQHARFGLGLTADGIAHDRHPLHLLDLAAQLPERALVSDGLAGTWLWRQFQPPTPSNPQGRHRVLVHNCLECYEESTYRDVYQHIRYGLPGWDAEVARLGIRTFVLKHTTPGERRFQDGKPNLRQHLFASRDWVLVDFDDAASVYTARTGLTNAHPGLPTLDGFPVDPDTGRPRPGTPPATVTAALQAHAAAHPSAIGTLDMLTRHLLRQGDRAGAAAALAELRRRRPGYPAIQALDQALARR